MRWWRNRGNWVREYRAARADGAGLTSDERKRLRELEKENRKLREQLEFMGKSSAFFASRYR